MTQQAPVIDVAALDLALTGHQLRWLAAQGARFALPSGRTKNKFPKNWTEQPKTLEQAIQHAKGGGNVGLLTGKHSGGIVALDRDVNYPATLDMLGDLARTAKIQRENAPDRGKLLYRVKGAIPKSTAWKEHPKDEHPACELLSNGRHALMPPSEYDGGRYLLVDAECGILEITPAQLDGIWFVITGQHLDGTKAKQAEDDADSKEESHQFVQRVKDAWSTLEVFKHWRKDANGTEDDHGETRLLGNGGLMINDWRWYCHADSIGGDQIDAWHWCATDKPLDRTDGKAFWNTIKSMAKAANIPEPQPAHRNGSNGAGYSHGYTDDQPDSADLDTDAPQHRGPRLPSIDPRQQLRTLRDAALQAIIGANERDPRHPVLLQRGGQLVRLKTNEDGRTVAEIVTGGALLNILASVADWETVNEGKDGTTYTPAHPPQNVVTALLGAGDWPGLPVLDGIVYAPTFAKDGALHTAAGYDARTRLYMAGAVQLGDTTPTAANVRAARDLLFGELLVDFPFVDDASRAHALALFLLPFVRRMVDGPTPLHLVSATARGTGKSLMVSMALYAALGELAEPITSSPDPAEMDKMLTAKVIEGPPYLFIDNINGKLDSAALASALTQTRFNRRLLGTNQTVSGKVDWVWAGTANNPAISDELTRRMVLTHLDAGMEQPDRRTGFKHGDITAWAKAHRDDLVTAAVTLTRNWQENAAGRRWHERAKGSFEQWAEIMGGILDAAGVAGFLANDDQLREQAAPEVADLRAFVAAWAARFGQTPVSVKQLMSIASTVDAAQPQLLTGAEQGKDATDGGQNLLGTLLGNGNERSRETRLGFLLNDHRDRVFGNWRIVEAKRDSRTNGRRWQVVPAGGPDSAVRCSTLHNVDPQTLCEENSLSTSGDLANREIPHNVAVRLEQSNARAEKNASTDAPAQAHARTRVENPPKRYATLCETSQKAQTPEVDSSITLGQKEGETLCNVLQNGPNVLQNGLDAYLGRDLTPAELGTALQLANAAGARFRQLPAGGGLYRMIVDWTPEPATDDADELIARAGI